jgi:starch synthase (maltosyl-transferring)
MTKQRVIIEKVSPCIDNGKYATKRVEEDLVHVTADIFADGHDELMAVLSYKHSKERKWTELPLKHLQNDCWEGSFLVPKTGMYQFVIEAWVDAGKTWLHELNRKVNGGNHVQVELMSGALILERLAKKIKSKAKDPVHHWINMLNDKSSYQEAIDLAFSPEVKNFLNVNALRENSTKLEKALSIFVEHKKSEFSTWYEFFPRSAGDYDGLHGNFKDCIKRIPFVSNLGFDVLYFPPIHPIGNAFRKGKNNNANSLPGEPGSPWAIGSALGGHKDIHPELGTFDDFTNLVEVANSCGIDIAMDIAYQCAPDHPYVKSHPQWFKWRPDGTVQYAENPPKKYQDVLPLNFECDDWKALWEELKSVVTFWADKGIKIFRVDNPHTKSFAFWEWMIAEVKKEFPEAIFLAEAFTRPKIMARLAKVGFTQSYTYFTWRTGKQEIMDYINELNQSNSRNYFRPNFWPNTPDILPYDLQNTAFEANAIRLVLAATLSGSYGIYGPVFDLLETEPMPKKEEYLNSEKYEFKKWDWQTMTPMRKLIQKINTLRNTNKALQQTFNTQFCETDNNYLISYLKIDTTKNNIILCVVNLDANFPQAGFVKFPYDKLHIAEGTPIAVHDLLSENKYTWNKAWNYVMLDPKEACAHIFEISW